MTALEALAGLKVFLTEVMEDLKLPKENSNPTEYVSPYVSLITLPHKNFMPVNFQVPCVLIGITNGEDNEQQNVLSVRIMCATYSGEYQFNQSDNIPDEKGYIDLINLIERIKNRLVNAGVIRGVGVVDKPISYGIYDDQLTYPYWYGYMTFDVQIPITERQIEDF